MGIQGGRESLFFSFKFSHFAKMSGTWLLLLQLLSLTLVSHLFHTSLGDVGTAAQYSPPYLPTACYGSDPSPFPSSNLFGVAGDGIWDNGASCGRQYLVRCISASKQGACIRDQTIQIKIIDYVGSAPSLPTANDTTMVLSKTAYETIANPAIADQFINIEFLLV
ncbi:EG45-like domain containing protein [Corylus avellana]|uniref:EG45-like domain containing protein n=1 Tax=Corylus avellana TaxID=13451 RepID=UPI00286BB137|nr:EG45-like domain containing protein [Corylus avellana]